MHRQDFCLFRFLENYTTLNIRLEGKFDEELSFDHLCARRHSRRSQRIPPTIRKVPNGTSYGSDKEQLQNVVRS